MKHFLYYITLNAYLHFGIVSENIDTFSEAIDQLIDAYLTITLLDLRQFAIKNSEDNCMLDYSYSFCYTLFLRGRNRASPRQKM